MKTKLFHFCLRVVVFWVALEFFFVAGGQSSKWYTWLINKVRMGAAAQQTVLCLGDSITQGGGDHAYPRLLEEYLNRHASSRFRVINVAQAGKDSAYFSAELAGWLKEYQPDYVVIMLGLFDKKRTTAVERSTPRISLKSVQVVGRIIRNELNARRTPEKASASEPPEDKKNTPRKESFDGMDKKLKELYMYALVLNARKQYTEEEKVYALLLTSPDVPRRVRSKVFENLGRNLWTQRKYADYAQIMDNIPYYSWPDDWVENICRTPSVSRPVTAALEQRIQKNPSDQDRLSLLLACYEQAGEQAGAARLRKLRDAAASSYVNAFTQTQYLTMLKALEDAGVRPVLAQYPLRDTDTLRHMVRSSGNYERIIFVENVSNFQGALQLEHYKEYFVDRAAGIFGHGTPKGNQIIAENIGKAILGQSGEEF
ncbi:MAG: hypothetical protein KC897_03710 [Candidatus Omnitrophica bacterium]|nr:hypothetical protein [Candidatus Omnitrophota bacterium]MCB9719473.1 hypothetical protein [Candidatus Omnitrophota bacterium]